MKTISKRNLLVALFIVATISFTCFAIDRKLEAVYSQPDYEVLSAFNHYQMGPVCVTHETQIAFL